MNKFQDFINKIMQGRYGIDRFNKFLIYLAFVVSLIRLFLRSPEAMNLTGGLIWFLLLISLFRMFSRNVEQRYSEEIKFLKSTKPIRGEIELLKMRFTDRGKVKYIKCPNCKTVVKAPANVGKIKVKCRKCGTEFIKRV